MAARAARFTSPRRGAFGASLVLHGAVAAAAVLPFLRPEPIRPAMPRAVEMVWAAPEAAEAASPAEDLPAPAEPGEAPIPEPDLPVLHALAAPAVSEPPPAPPLASPPPLLPLPPAEPDPAPLAPPPPEPPVAAAPAPPARTAARSEPPRPAPRPRPPRPAPDTSGAPGPRAEPATGGAPAPAALPAPAAPPGPILITAPRYRSPPAPPVYPPRAVEFGLTGTVLVRARVTPDGSTEETRVWRSSGHALLDAAATAAVRRWAFEPASVDGRRVEAWVEVPVHFRLN